MLISDTICPYCKEPLRIEMTAQFIERIDPSVMEVYSQEFDRMEERASSQGKMMKMALGLAKHNQGAIARMMESMVDFPPVARILKCINCGAVLSVDVPHLGPRE